MAVYMYVRVGVLGRCMWVYGSIHKIIKEKDENWQSNEFQQNTVLAVKQINDCSRDCISVFAASLARFTIRVLVLNDQERGSYC